MGRFNTSENKGRNPGPRSAIKSKTVGREAVRVRTALGAPGYAREAQSELFLLAASFMGGDDVLHERSTDRYRRLLDLCATPEVYRDEVWAYNLINYLRNDAQMRTVSIVIACEIVRARLAAQLYGGMPVTMPGSYAKNAWDKTPRNRQLIDVACARADEPCEVLAYWTSKYGQSKFDNSMIPQPILNGAGDAAVRLWNEFSVLKYGGGEGKKAVSFKDLLRLARPTPRDAMQSILFAWITGTATLDGIEGSHPLPMITARQRLNGMSRELRVLDDSATGAFKDAGMTWENVSEWYPGGMSGQAWDAVIPNMGLMALIRNLRNFDAKGISKDSERLIISKLEDYETVAKSRVLPFRFFTAYNNLDSLRWGPALEQAIDYSISNVPVLSGRTLVLVDRSGSMFDSKLSDKSDVTFADVAALFGTVWKARGGDAVDLYQFGSHFNSLGGYQDHKGVRFRDYVSRGWAWDGTTKEVKLTAGGSVLRGMAQYHGMGGTELYASVEATYRPGVHDRVVIITDEQTAGYGFGYGRVNYYDDMPAIDKGTPVYIWNLAGYEAGIIKTGRYKRHTFGGLADSSFKMIPMLESGINTGWPWEM